MRGDSDDKQPSFFVCAFLCWLRTSAEFARIPFFSKCFIRFLAYICFLHAYATICVVFEEIYLGGKVCSTEKLYDLKVSLHTLAWQDPQQSPEITRLVFQRQKDTRNVHANIWKLVQFVSWASHRFDFKIRQKLESSKSSMKCLCIHLQLPHFL